MVDRREPKRKLGWIMIGLAPVSLIAATGVLVFSGVLTATTGQVLTARLLVCVGVVLFATGYSLIMVARLRGTDHAIVIAVTVIVVIAVSAAGLLTVWQLLFVNDTVAPPVRVALWVLVSTGAVGTALAPILRRLTSS